MYRVFIDFKNIYRLRARTRARYMYSLPGKRARRRLSRVQTHKYCAGLSQYYRFGENGGRRGGGRGGRRTRGIAVATLSPAIPNPSGFIPVSRTRPRKQITPPRVVYRLVLFGLGLTAEIYSPWHREASACCLYGITGWRREFFADAENSLDRLRIRQTHPVLSLFLSLSLCVSREPRDQRAN